MTSDTSFQLSIGLSLLLDLHGLCAKRCLARTYQTIGGLAYSQYCNRLHHFPIFCRPYDLHHLLQRHLLIFHFACALGALLETRYRHPMRRQHPDCPRPALAQGNARFFSPRRYTPEPRGQEPVGLANASTLDTDLPASSVPCLTAYLPWSVLSHLLVGLLRSVLRPHSQNSASSWPVRDTQQMRQNVRLFNTIVVCTGRGRVLSYFLSLQYR